MLTRAAAQQVSFNIGTIVRGLLPTDLDGDNLPPGGAPNVQMGFNSSSAQLEWWKFTVDWGVPANSTFVQQAPIPVAAFTQPCPGTRSCVPQPGTTAGLDDLGDRLLYRLAYRNMGTHGAWVANHS